MEKAKSHLDKGFILSAIDEDRSQIVKNIIIKG